MKEFKNNKSGWESYLKESKRYKRKRFNYWFFSALFIISTLALILKPEYYKAEISSMLFAIGGLVLNYLDEV